MRKPIILITGINGEIGHGLVEYLSNKSNYSIIGLDLKPPDSFIQKRVDDYVVGNILDKDLLERLNAEFEISTIFHLAAILSTRAEFSPRIAHDVNVTGTINLLDLAIEQGQSLGRAVKFFFPSSIAVYGISNLILRNNTGPVPEDQFRYPQTMYGCNKLYCENIGTYFARHYKRLSVESSTNLVDFRSIRLPGLISAHTMPSGGSSDYAPEMIHAAAMKKPYTCFVRENTVMPFMTMPDAIRAILLLVKAPENSLSRMVYNITSFSPLARDFRNKILSHFSDAKITFEVNDKRQAIVDSWPREIDDTSAREDWNWKPVHNFNSAFEDYLIPEICKKYGL